jgi:hypothetical protein
MSNVLSIKDTINVNISNNNSFLINKKIGLFIAMFKN